MTRRLPHKAPFSDASSHQEAQRPAKINSNRPKIQLKGSVPLLLAHCAGHFLCCSEEPSDIKIGFFGIQKTPLKSFAFKYACNILCNYEFMLNALDRISCASNGVVKNSSCYFILEGYLSHLVERFSGTVNAVFYIKAVAIVFQIRLKPSNNHRVVGADAQQPLCNCAHAPDFLPRFLDRSVPHDIVKSDARRMQCIPARNYSKATAYKAGKQGLPTFEPVEKRRRPAEKIYCDKRPDRERRAPNQSNRVVNSRPHRESSSYAVLHGATGIAP